MPTEYEDEYDEDSEKFEKFFEAHAFDALNTPVEKLSPEEEALLSRRVRCSWNMSDIRKAELHEVAEKWLDDFLKQYEDDVVPKSKEKMLRLLTEVVIPTARLFGLYDDADLERKVTPDHTAIELLIDTVDDYFYKDDTGIQVRP
jgi:hypothetical protein